MTLSELHAAQAAILGVTVAELTILGLNLGLLAANAVRLQAEQLNDFTFQRKLATVSVSTVTGGSLGSAVLYGTATTANMKTLIDVAQLDSNGNAFPVEWTTTEESLERLRTQQGRPRVRYPTDDQYENFGYDRPRITFTGDNVYTFPRTTEAGTITLLLETYCYSPDWTATTGTVTLAGSSGATGANTTYYQYGTYSGKPLFLAINPAAGAPTTIYAIWYKTTSWVISLATDVGSEGTDFFDLTSTSQSPAGTYSNHGAWAGTAIVVSDSDGTTDVWLTKGFNYILWASVVWLNSNDSAIGKKFVPRTEGNLPPPQALADAALAAFITNDTGKFETFRRHRRG